MADSESENDVYGDLFFDLGWPETTAQGIDDFGVYGCLVAGIAALLSGLIARGCRRPWTRWIDASCGMFVAIWMAGLAVTKTLRGEAFAEISLGEFAVRYATPVALAILGWQTGRAGARTFSRELVRWILAVATSVTFSVHGWKAFQHHAPLWT